MASRALSVAIVASVLFVAVISVDAAVNRVTYLEMNQGGRWVALAQDPYRYGVVEREFPAPHTFNASDTLEFRLRIENGYPWGMDEDWTASVGGVPVGGGRISAPAFGDATATFTVNGTRLKGGGYGSPAEPMPAGGWYYPYIEVRVGSALLGASPGFQEVPR